MSLRRILDTAIGTRQALQRGRLGAMREPKPRLGRFLSVVGLVAAGVSGCWLLVVLGFRGEGESVGDLLRYVRVDFVVLVVGLALWGWGRRMRPVAHLAAAPRGARRGLRWVALLVSVAVLEVALRSVLGNFASSELRARGGCTLEPGAEVEYTGWLLRIPPVRQSVNALGYRGAPRPVEKPAGTLRILLLGDSFTFGQGMPDDRTIAAFLEDSLAAPPTQPVEVLNFGVEGLNLEEVLERYEGFASRWEHDVLLYLLSSNDLDAPGCGATEGFSTLIRSVYVVRVPIMLRIVLGSLRGSTDPTDEPRLVSGLDRFAAAARRHDAGFGLVVIASPVDAPASSWAGETPVLDVSEVLLEVEGTTIPREGHLNEHGGRLIATAMAGWLREEPSLRNGSALPGADRGPID